jgi:hypothetical protein
MAAIYQWFPGAANYEYILLSANENDSLHYVGYDFDTGAYRVFAKVYEIGTGIEGTQNFWLTAYAENRGANAGVKLFAWRGHCFSEVSKIDFKSVDTYNPSSIFLITNDESELLVARSQDYGHGFSRHSLPTSPPWIAPPTNEGYTLSIEGQSGAIDAWTALFDYCHNNKGRYEKGDSFVTGPNSIVAPSYPTAIATYTKITSPPGIIGMYQNTDYEITWGAGGWQGGGVNRESGYGVVNRRTFLPGGETGEVYPFKINEDLTITMLTRFFPAGGDGSMVAGSGSDYNHIILCEDDGATNQGYIRTYSTSGTMIDEYAVEKYDESYGGADLKIYGNSILQQSPYTKRFWLMTMNYTVGSVAFSVDPDGMITKEGQLPLSTASEGFNGQRAVFLQGPMNTTTNGYEGIKQKLYEYWAMDEAGTANRVGEMNGNELIQYAGTISSVSTALGDATYFDGASYIDIQHHSGTTANLMTRELENSSQYSLTAEIWPDVNDAGQVVFARQRASWNTHMDFMLEITADGYFQFSAYGQDWENLAAGMYKTSIKATDTPITAGNKYHVYVTYVGEEQKLKIRVNNGLLHEVGLPLHWSHAAFVGPENTFRVGGGNPVSWNGTYFFTGKIKNLTFFWDTLSSDEQDFMYNDGNSRTYAEL